MLTHRAYTSTKATTLAEIRPRRPFNAEIPEDDGVDVGVPEDEAVSICHVDEQLEDGIDNTAVLDVVVIVNPVPVNVLPDEVPS